VAITAAAKIIVLTQRAWYHHCLWLLCVLIVRFNIPALGHAAVWTIWWLVQLLMGQAGMSGTTVSFDTNVLLFCSKTPGASRTPLSLCVPHNCTGEGGREWEEMIKLGAVVNYRCKHHYLAT